jgi:glycosyltransferase involved in cell wall biosynthesis/predicted O-methyltransferase YrrM
MKIAIVCTEYPPLPHGGIGSVYASYAPALAAAGHEVTVIGIGPEASTRVDHGVRVELLPAAKVPRLSWYLNRRRVHDYVEQGSAEGRFDVVEVPDFQGWLPFTSRSAIVVVRLHLSASMIAKAAGSPLPMGVGWCEARTLAAHRAWIGVSDYSIKLTRDTFPHVEPDVSAVVYSPIPPPDPATPVDPTFLSGLPHRFILFAGTLSFRKGALALALAARDVLSANPNVSLVYIGAEPAEPGRGIRAEITAALGSELAGRCLFLGRRSRAETMAAMRAAEVFAFPSTLETFGLVVAEAMLQGCPVVTNDMPPFPEFVRHERTGLLVPPGDIPALSGALSRLLTDPGLRQRLSEEGRREVAARFSTERCVAESVAFYERCVQEHRAAPRVGRSLKSRVVSLAERLAPALTERLRNRLTMRRYALRQIRRFTNDVVVGGPFRGMRYVAESRGSSLLPKLVGSYESELHDDIDALLASGGFDKIIDVGCAEGYYAVGLAMRAEGAHVVAYDLDPTARQYCAKLAALNGVEDRIDIRGACTLEDMREVVSDRSLLVMDCEGAEVELLQPDAVPGLVNSTILVELHDFLVPGAGAAVRARFEQTHDVQTRTATIRSGDDFPQVAGLPTKIRNFAVDEGRIYGGRFIPQEWLVMTPKARQN